MIKKVLFLLFLLVSVVGWSQEKDSIPRLGSSDQVDNRIELDRYIKHPVFELSFLDKYFAFKDSLKAKTGFSFGTGFEQYENIVVNIN